MGKIKTSELIGPALNWVVAKCESLFLGDDLFGLKPIIASPVFTQHFKPSTDWSQGGPIIEREKISTTYRSDHNIWVATIWPENFDPATKTQSSQGPTPLIATMRCYVASKLGDEVEIPDELQRTPA